MKIESVTLKGFQCFGPGGATITLDGGVTALVGPNGAGKTAFLQALLRLFGVTASQRRVVVRDFHLPPDKGELQSEDHFSIDVLLSFPELDDNNDLDDSAVPEFFQQMTVSGPGEPLKARMMLVATWTNDGTPEGYIDEDLRWIPTLGDEYSWESCQRVQAVQRGTIQMVYVPATRNVSEQVTGLLKGRLWQAAIWSEDFKQSSRKSAEKIQEQFQNEKPAKFVLERLEKRWKQVHEADTETNPTLRLLESRFEEFVRRAEFAFFPDEAEKERSLDELSDGQRSLFHIALTAATLEVERDTFAQRNDECAFEQEKLRRTHLTLLAVEEPENSLAPFFLSRIVEQAKDIGSLDTAQVLLSSHSPAILGRIEPDEVRYFRLDRRSRTSSIRQLRMPKDDKDASKYLRLAIRAYPELYFARFVILGEGDSEQLLIPRIAESMGIALDPSFVPIVPLGGRYVTHFWQLLDDLEIPFATLLDLDMGREHGGANMIRSVAMNLEWLEIELSDTAPAIDGKIDTDQIEELDDTDLWIDGKDYNGWLKALEEVGVFFSYPLDIDFAMLTSFPSVYQHTYPSGSGPRTTLEDAKVATLKKNRDESFYEEGDYDEEFFWYPYLFLRRSKPETHLAALSSIPKSALAKGAPLSLKSLVKHVESTLDLDLFSSCP